jgi:N-carbamoyl-L-amino-acid hydrolase
VPGGGAFDGPLGIVSAFCAVDAMRESGLVPAVPLAVACFGDEEGARFGVACAGSRLLTGALAADRALALRDADGTTMAEAMARAGHSVDGPTGLGADPETMARVGTYVELHIEQGGMLPDGAGPVGVGAGIWPHGRWRVELEGHANHAGTTPLDRRRDPMLDLAELVLAARASASAHGALATVGKVLVEPNGVNAIPSQVTAWLDARAAEEGPVRAVLADLERFAPQQESWTPTTVFDAALAARCAGLVGAGAPVPVVATGAGHDAGILSAAGVPTAMLVVRNPTGISHSPEEHAETADCLAGVEALTAVLTDLTGARR